MHKQEAIYIVLNELDIGDDPERARVTYNDKVDALRIADAINSLTIRNVVKVARVLGPLGVKTTAFALVRT